MVANTLRDEEAGGGLCGGGYFSDFNNGADIVAGGTRAFFDDVPGWRVNLADSSRNATDLDACLARCVDMDSCKHASFAEQCPTELGAAPGGCCFLYETEVCQASEHPWSPGYQSFSKRALGNTPLPPVPPTPAPESGFVPFRMDENGGKLCRGSQSNFNNGTGLSGFWIPGVPGWNVQTTDVEECLQLCLSLQLCKRSA